MRVLYFHNSVPDYRKKLFARLQESTLCIKYVFTIFDYNLSVYSTDVDSEYLNRLNYKVLSKGHRAIEEVKKLIISFKPEIIVLPALDTIRELVIAMSILQYKNCDMKLIYFWEKWEAPFYLQPLRKKIKNGIQRLAFRSIRDHVDLFLSPGRKTDEYFLSNGVSESKLFRFRDVSDVDKIETSDIRNEFNIGVKRIYLYYGRIIKRKGLDLLIKAISQSSHRKNIFLLIVGDGEYKEFCEVYAAKELGDSYAFVGYVNPKYKFQYFSQSDVFVLPSRIDNGTIEAWGLTVNEALLTDNVVICSDAVGSAFELIDSSNGFIFSQDNVNELTSCIDKAYEFKKDENYIKKISKFKEEYTFENMERDFEEAFFKVYKN